MPLILTSRSDEGYKPGEGFPCLYFDGKTSTRYNVKLYLYILTCFVEGDGISREEPVAGISVSEPFAGTSRLIKFKDGAYCEIEDSASLRKKLSAAGYRESFSSWIQGSLRTISIAFIMLLILLAAGYRWGLPFAAEIIAYRVPQPVLSYITSSSIDSLDGKWIFPSGFSSKKQESIISDLKRIKLPEQKEMTVKVIFRKSDILGANAFALPDGTILILDHLVEIAKSNDELIAVYSHEAGHVAYRHSLRQVIHNSAIAAFIAVYIGDVSTIAGALTGWILESGYSRDFERIADRYAARVLTENNLSPLLLANILTKIESDFTKRNSSEKNQKFFNYISTHPSTEERVRELEMFIKK